MPEFVMVPVPPDLVTAVMKLVTEHEQKGIAGVLASSPSVTQHPAESDSPFVTEESREWTRSQLQTLSDSSAKSIKLFCNVLDILAAGPEGGMTIADVSKITGVPALTMQNSFGPGTTWMRNHVDGDTRWPIYWPAGDKWALSPNNREHWRAIRG